MNAVEGNDGVRLADGVKLTVRTRNTEYDIEIRGEAFFIKGHPIYCPDWTEVAFKQSHYGCGFVRLDWIGVDMHMEWWSNEFGTVTTSVVESIIRRN